MIYYSTQMNFVLQIDRFHIFSLLWTQDLAIILSYTCATYPGTMGYFEAPRWFLVWWRSVWQMPQYRTFSTTSSAPVLLLPSHGKLEICRVKWLVLSQECLFRSYIVNRSYCTYQDTRITSQVPMCHSFSFRHASLLKPTSTTLYSTPQYLAGVCC
jgi:hypothetical protein